MNARLRFEVLARDQFRCRYCGATASETELHVDHVVPVSLGGTDTADNLVAACRQCNLGKGSATIDQLHLPDLDIATQKWAIAKKRGVALVLVAHHDLQSDANKVAAAWDTWRSKATGEPVERPDSWAVSVQSFLARGVPLELLIHHVDTAMTQAKGREEHAVWSYYCGIIHNIAADIERTAQAILDGEL